MIDFGAPLDINPAVSLVVLSFFAFVCGVIFRKWPEKVQKYTQDLDGSARLLTPEAHREVIETCGTALKVLSFVALIAAGIVL